MDNQVKPFQVFAALPPDQLAALKADIMAHGVQVPVIVDEDGSVHVSAGGG